MCVGRPSAARPPHLRRVSVVCPPRGRRPSESIRHKAKISLISAYKDGGHPTDRRRSRADVRRMHFGCPSIACPSHCRRTSAALPSHIRRASVVRPPHSPSVNMTDGRRLCGGRTTDVRRSPVCGASAALPSRVLRLSAARPPSIRHKAKISLIRPI